MKISAFFALLVMAGCGPQQDSVPKPHAYPRVSYPARNYVQFSDEDCPFIFDYPDYATVDKRTTFLGDAPDSPCWFDLVISSLNARIHFSYHPVSGIPGHDELVKDAFTIANKINQRSNYMDEIRVLNPHGVTGLVMEFQGAAASPMHFYLTDSTQHFLKAALYYQSQVVPDSLEPINVFVKEDIALMINSLQWR